MDDGKHKTCTNRGLGLSWIILILLNINRVDAFDTEIENMRQEGLERYDISIYVEERVEYIHSRIDLKPLISSIDHGRKLTIEFETLANSSFGKILSTKVRRMVAKVEKKLEIMYGRRLSKAERRKRAIEFVGNLISRLCGNPGPEDWKQNTRNILAMKSAIDRQRANSVILHDDIDQIRHSINLQNENLRHVSREVINNVNRLDRVDNALTELVSYLELESMFESITEILESLDDISRDAKTGRCNEKGLDPDFLVDHLRRIESNKAGIAPIFSSWEWQKYYSFELCTLAVHDNEVWITMRIPIINLADQLVRAIPTSNQMWFQSRAKELGLDITLFRHKQMDTYMLMTRSNLETCSKLGTMRVCAVRKTKFKEYNPYVVPIDIGHNRIVITSNVTTGKEIDSKSVCGQDVASVQVLSHSVIRVPDNCVVVAKTFEISKVVANFEITRTTSINLDKIDKISMHKITKKRANVPTFETSKDLPTKRHEFDYNNNRTIDDLKLIKTDPFTTTETLLIASSGSMSVLAACLIIVILILYCLRRSRTSKNRTNEQVVVVVDRSNKQETFNDETVDLINEKHDSNNQAESSIQQSNDESKKPPFQRKH